MVAWKERLASDKVKYSLKSFAQDVGEISVAGGS